MGGLGSALCNTCPAIHKRERYIQICVLRIMFGTSLGRGGILDQLSEAWNPSTSCLPSDWKCCKLTDLNESYESAKTTQTDGQPSLSMLSNTRNASGIGGGNCLHGLWP